MDSKAKAKAKDKYLQTTYGITLAEYNELLKSQNYVCYICNSPPKSKALAVDHNHRSGEPRGALCFRCNKWLVGCIEKMYKNPRTILNRLNEYFTKYRMKGE